MKRCILIITSVMLLTALEMGQLNAQPKAVSSIWSFSGIGLGYEYHMDENSFGQVEISTEMSEMFLGKDGVTGVSASFTWNMIFARAESHNRNTISFYSGPGAVIGWAQDYSDSPGAIFGLKGRVGAECTFERNIAISVCIAPVLGMHISHKDEMISMRLYRNGLLYGLFPEVGIKYAF